MPMPRDELIRLLDGMKVEFAERMGEMRRKTDERHRDNATRLDALETVPGRIEALNVRLDAQDKQLAQLLSASTSTRDDVGSLVSLLKFGRGAMTLGAFLRRTVILLAQVGAALGVLYGLYLWLLGRGPFPGGGH